MLQIAYPSESLSGHQSAFVYTVDLDAQTITSVSVPPWFKGHGVERRAFDLIASTFWEGCVWPDDALDWMVEL
jgi:hypothetical protein